MFIHDSGNNITKLVRLYELYTKASHTYIYSYQM